MSSKGPQLCSSGEMARRPPTPHGQAAVTDPAFSEWGKEPVMWAPGIQQEWASPSPQALCAWMKERTSSFDSLSGSWGFWESCTRMPSPHSQKRRP